MTYQKPLRLKSSSFEQTGIHTQFLFQKCVMLLAPVWCQEKIFGWKLCNSASVVCFGGFYLFCVVIEHLCLSVTFVQILCVHKDL